MGWEKTYRVSSFFGKEKILGSYLSRLWPIFFGLYILLFKKRDILFYLILLIFILSEALIFLSGDRTAFFYINFSAIFVIIFSLKLVKLRLITLFTSLLLLFFISLINTSAKERVFDHTVEQMNLLNNNDEGIYIFTKQHTHHYITAYKMFLDNKILGVGVKNFRNFCSDSNYQVSNLSCSTHPHNTYIQLLSETGIIGLSFLLIVLYLFIKYIFKHFLLKLAGKFYFTDFEICLLSGIVIYLFPFVPTGSFFNNWLSIILFLNLPFLICSRSFSKFKN